MPAPRRLELAHKPQDGERRPSCRVRYIEAASVISRLAEAFAGDWSFTIEKHEIHEDEVIVLGRLTAGTVNKSAFGSSAITRTRDGGKAVSIGDDLKAAATDALKKAATLLGVGLTLHAATETNVSSRPQPAPSPASGNGFLSSAQLRAIHGLRRRLGWSEERLAEHAARLSGTADLERMTKRVASQLIESLQAEAAPTGASR